jgi:TusA-related sulfurtransferase
VELVELVKLVLLSIIYYQLSITKMATYTLDITQEHCPMTFVKTKLRLAQLQAGDILEVQLAEGEPLENVPRSATEQGYKVLSVEPVGNGVHKVTIEK